MFFVLYCTDKPNSVDLRVATRPAHVDYLKAPGSPVKLAGPYLNDAGEMIGGMVVIDVADKAAAEKFAAEDPYTKVDLFQSVRINPWRWAIGNPDVA
jgi:uncharacterized protein